MPSLLLHFTVLERLARDTGSLPEDMARALGEDMEYARFGAAILKLPLFAGLRAGVDLFLQPRRPSDTAALLRNKAPVAMGLKMGELVATGGLVGKEPGLAVLIGHFAHICLDRALYPLTAALLKAEGLPPREAMKRLDEIEWSQALLYLRHRLGRDWVASYPFPVHMQVTKSPGFPTRGIGRGLYELLRLSLQETVGQAPRKSEVDLWVKGLYVYSGVLASPLGRMRLPGYSRAEMAKYFQGPGIDVPRAVDESLAELRKAMQKLSGMIARGSFSARSRAKFLEAFPEGAAEVLAA